MMDTDNILKVDDIEMTDDIKKRVIKERLPSNIGETMDEMKAKYQDTTQGLNVQDNTFVSDSFASMEGLNTQLDLQKEEEERNRPKTRWERKKDRIFGESKQMRNSFFMGAIMGGGIGGVMGGLTGTFFAF